MGKIKANQAIKAAMTQLLKTGRKDNVLILYPPEAKKLATSFYENGQKHIEKMCTIQVDFAWGQNPFEQPVLSAIQSADSTIILGSDFTPTHLSSAIPQKVLCISASNLEELNRFSTQKVNRVLDKTLKFAEILSIGKTLHISGAHNTDLQFSIQNITGQADAGGVPGSETCFSLPVGEVRFQPEPKTLNGRIAIHALAGRPPKYPPASAIIKNNHIVQIKGQGEIAQKLRRQLRLLGSSAKEIIEMGIGLNEHLPFSNTVSEDKKALGAITFSIGANETRNTLFRDLVTGILFKPDVTVDGKSILKNGELILL